MIGSVLYMYQENKKNHALESYLPNSSTSTLCQAVISRATNIIENASPFVWIRAKWLSIHSSLSKLTLSRSVPWRNGNAQRPLSMLPHKALEGKLADARPRKLYSQGEKAGMWTEAWRDMKASRIQATDYNTQLSLQEKQQDTDPWSELLKRRDLYKRVTWGLAELGENVRRMDMWGQIMGEFKTSLRRDAVSEVA